MHSDTASSSGTASSIASMDWKLVDAVDAGVAAGGGDEAVVGILRQGRQVLVADDLADADDAELDGVLLAGHGSSGRMEDWRAVS